MEENRVYLKQVLLYIDSKNNIRLCVAGEIPDDIVTPFICSYNYVWRELGVAWQKKGASNNFLKLAITGGKEFTQKQREVMLKVKERLKTLRREKGMEYERATISRQHLHTFEKILNDYKTEEQIKAMISSKPKEKTQTK